MLPGSPTGPSRVAVFASPNHELAVFGWLARARPHLVFLTDGGSLDREADSRRALAELGIEERATFLAHPERAFYGALLSRDVDYYQGVAAEVGALLDRLEPTDVFSSAVELYNPVHDLALPITVAALGSRPASFFSIPLIAESLGEGEKSPTVQRALSRRRQVRALELSGPELTAKAHARAKIYRYLRRHLGHRLDEVPEEELARECFIGPLEGSERADFALELGLTPRYERRGELLHARGEVDRVIYHDEHYEPVARALTRRSLG